MWLKMDQQPTHYDIMITMMNGLAIDEIVCTRAIPPTKYWNITVYQIYESKKAPGLAQTDPGF